MNHLGRKGMFAALIALLLVAVLLPMSKPAEADLAYLKVCGTDIDLSQDGTYLNGQVNYNASARVLTLMNVDFSTEAACIETGEIPLTVTGSGKLFSMYSSAIEVYGQGDLTLNGTFDCESHLTDGIQVQGPMVIAGGCVSTTSGISAGALYLANELSIVYPENGTVEEILNHEAIDILIKAPSTYGISVGGVEISDENCHDVLNNGQVRYRYQPFGSSILTLDNADIDGSVQFQNSFGDTKTANIYCNKQGFDLTLNLIGDNKLRSADYAINIVPSDSSAGLTVTGPGTLTTENGSFCTVVYGDITVKDTTVTTNRPFYAKKTLSIENSKITVNTGGERTYGLQVEQALNIKDSLVTIDAGFFGVNASDAINISGDSTVSITSPSTAIFAAHGVNLSGRIALLEPEGGSFVNGYLKESDGTTTAKKAVYTSVYNVFVGGAQVTGLNMSGEGWAFTPAEGDDPAILELNNYHYEGIGALVDLRLEGETEPYYSAAAIFYDEAEPLTVRLVGENTLLRTGGQDIQQAFGLYCRSSADDALMIFGTDEEASLSAACGAQGLLTAGICSRGDLMIGGCTANAASEGSGYCAYGLYAARKILIDDCEITAAGGEAPDTSFGIIADAGNIVLSESSVTATCGASRFGGALCSVSNSIGITDSSVNLTAADATETSVGMYAGKAIIIKDCFAEVASGASGFRSDAIYANDLIAIGFSEITTTAGGGQYSCGLASFAGGVIIMDSTVKASGGPSAYQSCGVYAEMNITIKNSTVEAKGAAVTAENGVSNGFFSFGSTVIADNSDVTAIAGEGFESYGACAYGWDDTENPQSITVEDSKLTAIGVDGEYGGGILVNNLIVCGESEVTAVSGTSAGAIIATSEFDLQDDLAIVTPFNGAYGRNGSNMITVFADEETAAGTVVIKPAATVTFKDEDGMELQSGKVALGDTPVYYGEMPTKPSTSHNEYAFAGWDPALVPVTAEATYTATYNEDLLHPTFVGGRMIALDNYIVENDTMLYRYDVRVIDVPDGALSINSAQIFLTYNKDQITFVRGEGMVDWQFNEQDGVLSAAWASDVEVLLHNDDVVLTLYFAKNLPIEADFLTAVRFTQNAHGNGSALSFVNGDATTELVAKTEDGYILFDVPLWGDANADGMVTSADAATVLRAVVGLSRLGLRGSLQADVDGDGMISAEDAALILQFVVGIIEAFPVE